MSQEGSKVRSSAEIERQILELGNWFHNIRLGGIETAPNHFLGDYPQVKWKRFAHTIPNDLSGKSVLDIGCNAGFYSLEMKRRGAMRVVGIDDDLDYLKQAEFAAEVCGLELELHQLSVYKVEELKQRFDIVLFLGVFYHLRHPLLALDLIREHVAGELLVFQSMLRGSMQVPQVRPDYDFWEIEQFNQPGFPAMYFIENSYSGDNTNWWIPNRAGVEATLRSAGFQIISHPEEEVFVCRCDGGQPR